ncbi:MAG: hypothetical protein KIT69_21200 [Propionibacteriaceae bacterium]|nr:hypothetical protein [Propionibacteriaceae bacterium]
MDIALKCNHRRLTTLRNRNADGFDPVRSETFFVNSTGAGFTSSQPSPVSH